MDNGVVMRERENKEKRYPVSDDILGKAHLVVSLRDEKIYPDGPTSGFYIKIGKKERR